VSEGAGMKTPAFPAYGAGCLTESPELTTAIRPDTGGQGNTANHERHISSQESRRELAGNRCFPTRRRSRQSVERTALNNATAINLIPAVKADLTAEIGRNDQ